MMAVTGRQLNSSERVWLDRRGDPINIDRAWQKSDQQIGLSRRSQAMLAAAGESGPELRWYVIRTEKHAEKDVDNSLAYAGIECWLPTEKKIRCAPHAKRKVIREVAALPGYVFVKVADTDATWAGLFSIEGVAAVLGGACGPVPVSDENMLIFKKKLGEKSTDKEVVEAAFPLGARVRIEDGPFASFGGTIDELLDTQRATVLVEIFGRFVPTELRLAQITKTD
jgi:transcription antitermination factor NusG